MVYSKTYAILLPGLLSQTFSQTVLVEKKKNKHFNFIVQQDAPEVSEESPDPIWPAPTEKLQRLVPLVHGDKARI